MTPFPFHAVPVDQRQAYREQHAFALDLLARLRAKVPHLRMDPKVQLYPNGYWDNLRIAGFCDSDHSLVMMPLAGAEGVEPGDGLVFNDGLSLQSWVRILIHEIAHLFEFAMLGGPKEVANVLRRSPIDDQRPSWRIATRLLSSHLGIGDAGHLRWPLVVPPDLLASAKLLPLAPRARHRIQPDGEIGLLIGKMDEEIRASMARMGDPPFPPGDGIVTVSVFKRRAA